MDDYVCLKIDNKIFKPISRFAEDAKNGRPAWVRAEDGTGLGWAFWNEQFDQWFPQDDSTVWEIDDEPYWFWK